MPAMAVGFTPPAPPVPLANRCLWRHVGAVRHVGDAAYGLLTARGNTMRRVGIALAFLMIGALTAAGTVQAQSLGIFRWQKEPYCNVISSTVVQTGGLFQAVGLFMWTTTFGISALSGTWRSWLLIHHDQFGDCVAVTRRTDGSRRFRRTTGGMSRRRGLRRPCLMCSSPGATSLGRPSSRWAAFLHRRGLPRWERHAARVNDGRRGHRQAAWATRTSATFGALRVARRASRRPRYSRSAGSGGVGGSPLMRLSRIRGI